MRESKGTVRQAKNSKASGDALLVRPFTFYNISRIRKVFAFESESKVVQVETTRELTAVAVSVAGSRSRSRMTSRQWARI
jgi:hypothetical protein